MKTVVSVLLGLLALATLLIVPGYIYIGNEFRKLESDDPAVWENVIQAFEEEDRENAPGAEILFTGSSSIRFWTGLEEDMAPLQVLNRGFGGSKVRDIIYYFDRIVLPHDPEIIVLFAGTNDISGRYNDKSPAQLLRDIRELGKLIQKSLPHSKLVYLSITPTISRWKIWPRAKAANALIQDYMESQKHFYFVDASSLFLDEQGQPDGDLFRWDGVHLNQKGYARWSNKLKPLLERLIIE